MAGQTARLMQGNNNTAQQLPSVCARVQRLSFNFAPRQLSRTGGSRLCQWGYARGADGLLPLDYCSRPPLPSSLPPELSPPPLSLSPASIPPLPPSKSSILSLYTSLTASRIPSLSFPLTLAASLPLPPPTSPFQYSPVPNFPCPSPHTTSPVITTTTSPGHHHYPFFYQSRTNHQSIHRLQLPIHHQRCTDPQLTYSLSTLQLDITHHHNHSYPFSFTIDPSPFLHHCTSPSHR